MLKRVLLAYWMSLDRQDLERNYIVGNGQPERWRVHPRVVSFLVGEVHSPTLTGWTKVLRRQLWRSELASETAPTLLKWIRLSGETIGCE